MKRWYSSLRLHTKISIPMIVLLVLLSLISSAILTTFFAVRYVKESMIIAQEWLDLNTYNIDQDINAIFDAVITSSVTPDFVTTASRSILSEERNLQVLVEMQRYLHTIDITSPLVEASVLIDRNNNNYSTYHHIPKYNLDLLDYHRLAGQRQIWAYSTEASPFTYNQRVVPLVIPLNFLSSSSYLEISRSSQPDLLIAILLNEEALYKQLNENQSLVFTHESTVEFAGKNLLSEVDYATVTDKTHLKIQKETNIDDLFVTMIIDRASFRPPLLLVILVSALTAIAFSLIGSALVLVIAKRTTRDFSTMTQMIEEIGEGTYTGDITPRYSDEVGALIDGMNQMWRTLGRQMAMIQHEEEEKYRYRSQMLTEQINPHFIYNTLEIINMEVNKEHYQGASEMIQAFASFLRYSLNQGEDMTTLQREVDHIRKYLMIMNTRLGAQIIFSSDCPAELQHYRIPKSILLPLVENAIRHGFDTNGAAQPMFLPTITIQAQKTAEQVTLRVIDNGKGIDIAQATKALTEGPSPSGHVGLNNIYHRLSLYFSRVEMDFSSIPGYSNVVSITLEGPIQTASTSP